MARPPFLCFRMQLELQPSIIALLRVADALSLVPFPRCRIFDSLGNLFGALSLSSGYYAGCAFDLIFSEASESCCLFRYFVISRLFVC